MKKNKFRKKKRIIKDNILLLPKNWTDKTILSDHLESRVNPIMISFKLSGLKGITWWIPIYIYIPVQEKQSPGYVEVDNRKYIQWVNKNNQTLLNEINKLIAYFKKKHNLIIDIKTINIHYYGNQHTHPEGIHNFSGIDLAPDNVLKNSRLKYVSYIALLYGYRSKKMFQCKLCKKHKSKWTYINVKINNSLLSDYDVPVYKEPKPQYTVTWDEWLLKRKYFW
jgi:hypothetical protein